MNMEVFKQADFYDVEAERRDRDVIYWVGIHDAVPSLASAIALGHSAVTLASPNYQIKISAYKLDGTYIGSMLLSELQLGESR